MYIHGRDHHFRPLIFVIIKVIKNILGKDYNFDDINKSIIFLMNYVLKYLLIPGQIENWIIFVDFDGVGITDLGDFQKIITALSKRRGRVFKNYFVNIGSFLKFSLKAIIKMVSSVAKKSIILSNNELNKVLQLISSDNLEQKYGGNAPNIIPGGNNLFPPIMPNANYALNGERLNIITPEEYKKLCMSDKRPYVICPEYKKIWEEEKALEELNKKKLEDILLTQNKIKYDKKQKNEVTKKSIDSDNNININDKKEIRDFLKEFEDLNNLDSFKDRKYNIPSKLNIKEINTFFNSLKQNQNFFE